jgi:hypothetical protein
MDLNYLYHRRQVSLMRAEVASCAPSRAAHVGLAALYAGAIAERRAIWDKSVPVSPLRFSLG